MEEQIENKCKTNEQQNKTKNERTTHDNQWTQHEKTSENNLK